MKKIAQWTIFWRDGSISYVWTLDIDPETVVRSLALQNAAATGMNNVSSNFFNAVKGDQSKKYFYNNYAHDWRTKSAFSMSSFPR